MNKARPNDLKPIRLPLDPLRLHEPARTKLSTIETQRIMIVFDDLIQKMELIEILPIVVSHVDLFKSVIDTYEIRVALPAVAKEIHVRLETR